MAKERRELEVNPEGELAELVQMLRVRGVEERLAHEVAVQLSRDPETALRLHIVAELGLSPEDKPSPRTAAVMSLLTFSLGALLPLLPYLFGFPVLWAALVSGGIGLVAAGVLSSLFTPRPWWYAGLRQLLFGAIAAGRDLRDRLGDRRHGRLSRALRAADLRPARARTAGAAWTHPPATSRTTAAPPAPSGHASARADVGDARQPSPPALRRSPVPPGRRPAGRTPPGRR